jgi:5,10-methylenetetrahydromethanopterin reductase
MVETVRFLQTLLGGETAQLSDYPALTARYRYSARSRARLYFPPEARVPVYVAAGGPRMFELAGRLGDGIVYSQTSPWSSIPGVERGLFSQAIDMVEAGRRQGGRTGPFKVIYTFLISVSEDGDRARQWAKRNTSYTLAGCYGRYPQYLEATGVPLGEELRAIRDAYLQGMGVDEGARRVSDELLAQCGFVSAGTPSEVIAQCAAVLPQLRERGVDHVVMGVPLGPDVPEALRLIAREVVPAVRRMLD